MRQAFAVGCSLNLERAMRLELTTLCLGSGEPLTAPQASFRIWRRTIASRSRWSPDIHSVSL